MRYNAKSPQPRPIKPITFLAGDKGLPASLGLHVPVLCFHFMPASLHAASVVGMAAASEGASTGPDRVRARMKIAMIFMT
jgi:hypothetical protein